MMITFTRESRSGLEREYELPAVHEVCDRCEGHGTHLHEAIGSHAYSAEEFAESFDDEERAEYFKQGGRYDVPCEACHGARVVKVVDEEEAMRTTHGRRVLALYHAHLDAEYAYACEVAAERKYGY